MRPRTLQIHRRQHFRTKLECNNQQGRMPGMELPEWKWRGRKKVWVSQSKTELTISSSCAHLSSWFSTHHLQCQRATRGERWCNSDATGKNVRNDNNDKEQQNRSMKASVAATKHKQHATINNSYNLLTLWWEEVAECGGGTTKSIIVNIFGPSCGSCRIWVCGFWRNK